MLNYLVNLPNHIPERQKAFQADPRLVHQKMPRARLYHGMYGAVFVTAISLSTLCTYKLIFGKK